MCSKEIDGCIEENSCDLPTPVDASRDHLHDGLPFRFPPTSAAESPQAASKRAAGRCIYRYMERDQHTRPSERS